VFCKVFSYFVLHALLYSFLFKSKRAEKSQNFGFKTKTNSFETPVAVTSLSYVIVLVPGCAVPEQGEG